MKIEQSTDFLIVTLENSDLIHVNKNGEYIYRKIENELKELEGTEKNKEKEHCWFVPAKHEKAVQKIYDTYFRDENQLGLFN